MQSQIGNGAAVIFRFPDKPVNYGPKTQYCILPHGKHTLTIPTRGTPSAIRLQGKPLPPQLSKVAVIRTSEYLVPLISCPRAIEGGFEFDVEILGEYGCVEWDYDIVHWQPAE